MKKYKLINKTTQEETICTKVNVDGFDYYVSDMNGVLNDWVVDRNSILYQIVTDKIFEDFTLAKKVICTKNQNIDIPKVIDEVERLANICAVQSGCEYREDLVRISKSYISGYNKHKETNPNSDEDVMLFLEYVELNYYPVYIEDAEPEIVGYWLERASRNKKEYSKKELLQIWKEQKVGTIYYE